MKKSVADSKDFGAERNQIRAAGRLGGAELGAVEMYHWGRVPLHTLRANIDYGFAGSVDRLRQLGIKCWICRVKINRRKKNSSQSVETAAAAN